MAVDGECVQAPTTINASPTIFFFFFGMSFGCHFLFIGRRFVRNELDENSFELAYALLAG